uniref:Uncharacterized protein n=1 Tax=Solanum lycopersicum TaxID=4081 RepID=A0A3Q7HUP8_SOLLC
KILIFNHFSTRTKNLREKDKAFCYAIHNNRSEDATDIHTLDLLWVRIRNYH